MREDGNPRPMLSDRTQFPSEEAKSIWRQKAALLFEVRDDVQRRKYSAKLADRIKNILVDDPETKNLVLAKSWLKQTLAACHQVDDETYANFLRESGTADNVDDAVIRSRNYKDSVATHIRGIFDSLPTT